MIISGKIRNKPIILELFDADLAKCRAKNKAKSCSELLWGPIPSGLSQTIETPESETSAEAAVPPRTTSTSASSADRTAASSVTGSPSAAAILLTSRPDGLNEDESVALTPSPSQTTETPESKTSDGTAASCTPGSPSAAALLLTSKLDGLNEDESVALTPSPSQTTENPKSKTFAEEVVLPRSTSTLASSFDGTAVSSVQGSPRFDFHIRSKSVSYGEDEIVPLIPSSPSHTLGSNANESSVQALSTSRERKLNQPVELPDPEDIAELAGFLEKKLSNLEEPTSYEEFLECQNLVLARLISYNRRRPGEVQVIK